MNTTYAIRNRDLLLDATNRHYVLKIRDLPNDDRPREKLIEGGPGALSVSDLLAVVLASGNRKEGILSMTSRIVKEYGEKSLFTRTDAKEIAADLDIPVFKAAQIVACGELGRRFFGRQANGAAVIRTARDVFEYVTDMRNLTKEHLRGLYLNNHYQVVHDEVISIGTVDSNIVHPREVFRPALAYSAAAVVLVHNHPSGIVEPSANDIAVTEQLVRAGGFLGIEVVDHVVVTKDSYASVPGMYPG